MLHPQIESCINACHACALACDRCAAACLHEANVSAMANCIALDIDCSEICRVAMASMARGSMAAPAICEACAKVCERCQEECDKYQMDHCRACAEACRQCLVECRAMVERAEAARHHSRDSSVAGLRQ